MKKSFISLAAFSAAGALALSGCVVNDSATSGSSESGSSDSITVACGAMEDLCQKWTETFSQQTGIKATYVRLSSGETLLVWTPRRTTQSLMSGMAARLTATVQLQKRA